METRSTFSILFYIKRTKLLKNGNAPIYLKITINGISAEVSLKRSIEPSQWNTTKNRVRGNNSDSINLNSYLQSVQSQLYTHHQKIQESGQADFISPSQSNIPPDQLKEDHTSPHLIAVAVTASLSQYLTFLRLSSCTANVPFKELHSILSLSTSKLTAVNNFAHLRFTEGFSFIDDFY